MILFPVMRMWFVEGGAGGAWAIGGADRVGTTKGNLVVMDSAFAPGE